MYTGVVRYSSCSGGRVEAGDLQVTLKVLPKDEVGHKIPESSETSTRNSPILHQTKRHNGKTRKLNIPPYKCQQTYPSNSKHDENQRRTPGIRMGGRQCQGQEKERESGGEKECAGHIQFHK